MNENIWVGHDGSAWAVYNDGDVTSGFSSIQAALGYAESIKGAVETRKPVNIEEMEQVIGHDTYPVYIDRQRRVFYIKDSAHPDGYWEYTSPGGYASATWEGLTGMSWNRALELFSLQRDLPAVVTIENMSRHRFSTDQRRALIEHFGDNAVLGEPRAPYFTGPEDFATAVSGKTAAIVAPTVWVLEALTEGMIADGTRLIVWQSDPLARKRGNHAIIAMKVMAFKGGRWRRVTLEVTPTVEVTPHEIEKAYIK